jgi:outer membrane lipoprotein LolB
VNRPCRFAVACLLVLLQACSSVGPLAPAKPVAETFVLGGRVSVRAGEETFSGSMAWAATGMGDDVLLSDPLGQGVASLSRSAAGVVLTPAGREPVHAQSAEELTEKVLGFRLPLAGLRYWVQGHPDPGRPFATRRDDGGGVGQLRQDGWVIDYLQYRDQRPRKIHVSREELEIRLVIDEWQAN